MARKKIRSKNNIKEMIKEHKFVLFTAIILGIVALIGAAFVLVWFVNTTDIINQGSMTISELSMATVLWFAFNLVLWELLFVGLPAGIIFGVGGYLWWSGLSKKQKDKFEDCKKDSDNGGIGFFLFIAYVIYLLVDGNFYTSFGDLPLSYWIFSYLWAALWLGIIVAIPMLVIGALWLTNEQFGKK